MPKVNQYAAAYRENLADNPDNQELNMSVAMCYLKLGMYDKAAEAFDKALENNFDNSEAFSMRQSAGWGEKRQISSRTAGSSIRSRNISRRP